MAEFEYNVERGMISATIVNITIMADSEEEAVEIAKNYCNNETYDSKILKESDSWVENGDLDGSHLLYNDDYELIEEKVF